MTHPRSMSPPSILVLQDLPDFPRFLRSRHRCLDILIHRAFPLTRLEVPDGIRLLLTLNGRPLRLLRPGGMEIVPPLELKAGDRLSLCRSRHGRRAMPGGVEDLEAPTKLEMDLALFDDPVPFAVLAAYLRYRRGIFDFFGRDR